MHEYEGQLGAQLTAQGAQEKLHFDGIGDNNAEGIASILAGNPAERKTEIINSIPFSGIAHTYSVVEASAVSLRLISPSTAMPARSQLATSVGTKYMTFCRLDPGFSGQPSLVSM